MPNHVKNIIHIKDSGGHSIEDIQSVLLNKDGFVDFNAIVQLPKCLEDFEPHAGIVGAAKAIMQFPVSDNPLVRSMQIPNRHRDLERYEKSEQDGGFTDKEKSDVDRAVSNIKECGYAYWYDWKIENWGTKWNAYDQPEDGFCIDCDTFEFQTAWSSPAILIKIVSEKLPGAIFEIKYADEYIGYNCGIYEIQNGKILSQEIDCGHSLVSNGDVSNLTKIAFEIWYGDEDPRSHGYDENWEYSDEVYDEYHGECKGFD